MKIPYVLIKKIHLYACLSTVAVLVMFIVTSYLMIHHNSFDHEMAKVEKTEGVNEIPTTPHEWRAFENQYQIKGRLTREGVNQDGESFREYASAAGSTRATFKSETNKVVFAINLKSKADALIGIHRQRGYSGAWQYTLYALLLDLVAVSLITFAITGVIMWFKLLKNSKTAWAIFVSGFIYFFLTIILLLYW
ncbi:MAG: PepSY-associated TM helix domain-containing protein [Saprospiraceae bacterium]|nr:PepSY-associated TM helix domain-containing protein [Saprospiraceae bacterium]